MVAAGKKSGICGICHVAVNPGCTLCLACAVDMGYEDAPEPEEFTCPLCDSLLASKDAKCTGACAQGFHGFAEDPREEAAVAVFDDMISDDILRSAHRCPRCQMPILTISGRCASCPGTPVPDDDDDLFVDPTPY